MDGKPLTFHLAGINNQNFLMRDEETGSWWQQVSGEAIRGPLAGRRLAQVHHEELTFTTWWCEKPHGRVLRPDEEVAAAGGYAKPDWEKRMARAPVVTALSADEPLAARELVLGVVVGSAARAYPLETLQSASPLQDELGGVPLALVLGPDGRSARCFDRRIAGLTVDLFALPDSAAAELVDAVTGSTFDFTGRATDGALEGETLARIHLLPDYWFDWKTYHPESDAHVLRP